MKEWSQNAPLRNFLRHLGDGAIMAATILNSPHATEVSVVGVRALVRLRELPASNRTLKSPRLCEAGVVKNLPVAPGFARIARRA